MIKKTTLIVTIMFSLISCGGPVEKETGVKEVRTQRQPTPVEIGKTFLLSSKIFETERKVSVKLPAQYDNAPEGKFPVLYLVDGGPEQDFPHIAGILQSTDINWTVEPMILVGVETVNRRSEITPPSNNSRYDEAFPNRGGADEFRKFLETEVMPWVEAKYRTDGRKILMGESLAGLFVTETYLKSPEMFTHFAAISPSLWWDELSVPKMAQSLLTNSNLSSALYLTMGSEGGEMQRGLDLLLASLQTNNIPNWTYVDRRNSEDHGSIYHPAALDVLRTYFSTPYRTGTSSDSFWMFKNGVVPPLSEKAKANIELPCTNDTAERISFETYNADPNVWRGMCVLIKAGPKPSLVAK